MSETRERVLSTYCPNCDVEVDATLENRPDSLDVRGSEVNYTATVAVCPVCHQVIADSRVEGANLERARAAYRSARGILSPGEIRGLRERYGLSLRAFSQLFGFGEQTIARYEAGSMPDESHNAALRLASSAAGARCLLDARRDHLPEKTIGAVERFIERDEDEMESLLALASPRMASPQAPDTYNGFRALDITRIASVAHELAARCTDLYWTKLQKALYFTDALAFELNSRSMTGIRYAHANYGPVAEERESIRLILEREGVIELAQSGNWGEVVLPGANDPKVLSKEDLAIVDKVARFVNTFPTATALSKYSHRLNSWIETRNGEPIDYASNLGEVTKAVNERIGVKAD